MDERGLWELFYRTGLPEAWLALVGARRERLLWEQRAMTALQQGKKQV